MRWCLSFPFLAPVFSGPLLLDILINPLYIMASPSSTCLDLLCPHRPHAPHLTCLFSELWLVLFLFPQLFVILMFPNWYEEINILLTQHSKYWLIERGHLWTVFPLSKGMIFSYGKFQAPRQDDWEIMFACLNVVFECACAYMFEEGIAARDIFS